MEAWARQNGAFSSANDCMDGASNLRYVPREVHQDISRQQQDFWLKYRRALARQTGKPLKSISIADVVKSGQVDWVDYQKLMDQIDESFSKYWLKPGASAEEVADVLKAFGVSDAKDLASKGIRNYRAGRTKLLSDFSKGLDLKGLKIIGLMAALAKVMESAATAKGICHPNEQQQAAFAKLVQQYDRALRDIERDGALQDNYREGLQKAIKEWLTAIEQEGLGTKIWAAMELERHGYSSKLGEYFSRFGSFFWE